MVPKAHDMLLLYSLIGELIGRMLFTDPRVTNPPTLSHGLLGHDSVKNDKLVVIDANSGTDTNGLEINRWYT